MINLFILSNIGSARSIEQPLISIDAQGGATGMKIQSMVGALQRRPPKYLDIQTRTVITEQQAFALANNGMDGGKLGGQDPPVGGWV